ncbi:hypothetical protein [Streptomyces phage phiScoe25]|nr:hypothetical protein [Streptomyces phage phiScoe25]
MAPDSPWRRVVVLYCAGMADITIETFIELEDGTLIPFEKGKLAPLLDPNDGEGWARLAERMGR